MPKCVERRSLVEIEETSNGDMKRPKIPKQERRWHLKSCAGSHQKKMTLNTNVLEIKREKLLLDLRDTKLIRS